ncbi:unnamed protein product [Vitrella brassicaformis CCMP3155]|uniref:YbaK/aminoacyl-tRNA synthetase-associated domain-containing protein n=1 Tax=Vitrella brassicaformis (strain CCMP3155) TaxID=1169540 RepID=A0A0G4EHC2_VITBC|nr:unnamed protein product [Vitrella brassicaformis CCMP3155]|mmetsp:Transcript_10275/g.29686  ORF Transcript_10275/g.29686 Transcript_10275/m.29686 type:complete len:177 (-) Transcript_10275:787-1317(-)|eukprot:CEL95383.1 unnamed protein product [Vitrella brassicaformis CCMP3155]
MGSLEESSAASDAEGTSTAATAYLSEHNVPFEKISVTYEKPDGGESLCDVLARQMNTEPDKLVKTMVFKYGVDSPCLVLMHGHKQVDKKKLARELGASVKNVKPADADMAARFTGYDFGGTSPFGTREAMAVYMEEGIREMELVYINGGSRQLVLRMAVDDLIRTLQPTVADLAAE